MALTRKSLKAMGLTDEQIESIIDMHGETVDALKDQRDQYKEAAEKLPSMQAQLEEATKNIENLSKDSWKVKYEALKEDHEKFVNAQKMKEQYREKEKTYIDLLKAAGIPEKRIPSIIKVSNDYINSIVVSDGEKIENLDEITKYIMTEWAEFIPVVTDQGADVPRPISQSEKIKFTAEDIRKMSPEEINKNFDAIKASLKGES